MRTYKSTNNKKKLKKDPGRYLLKKMKAEDQNDLHFQDKNILDNHDLDSELKNPVSDGGETSIMAES